MLPDKESVPYVDFGEIEESILLIDIRSEEAYQAFFIPNAINICVYEIAFIDKVLEKAEQDKEISIVVYGEDGVYRGADYAWSKLHDAGFENVEVLNGGIQAWHQLHGTEQRPETTLEAGKKYISPEKSRVLWFGRNLLNQHNGRIAINCGKLKVSEKGEISHGEIEVDMERITCDDLSIEQGNSLLIQHLQSSDFFLTKKYPTASFKFRSAIPIANASESSVNFEISGDLTIRGIARPFKFPAMVYAVENGYGLQAQIELNRTMWNVIYGSGSVFENLGMHVVSDLVSLQIQLIFDE